MYYVRITDSRKYATVAISDLRRIPIITITCIVTKLSKTFDTTRGIQKTLAVHSVHAL